MEGQIEAGGAKRRGAVVPPGKPGRSPAEAAKALTMATADMVDALTELKEMVRKFVEVSRPS